MIKRFALLATALCTVQIAGVADAAPPRAPVKKTAKVLPTGPAAPAANGDQLDADGARLDLSKFRTKGATLFSIEWKVRQIPVCWINPAPEDADKRELVRVAVHNTWEAASQVQMTGWGACQDGERAVRITVGDNEWPRAIVGRLALSSGRPTVWLNFNLARHPGFSGCVRTEERCLAFTSVHEFGHVLGLIHEQDRADTPDECIARLSAGQRRERSDSDVHLLTGYDPESLMNYCSRRGWDVRQPLSLTAEDASSISQMFGQPGRNIVPEPPRPVTQTPVTQPPVTQVVTPPVKPPVVTPSVVTPPVTPPSVTPPPVVTPPVVTPPTGNGTNTGRKPPRRPDLPVFDPN